MWSTSNEEDGKKDINLFKLFIVRSLGKKNKLSGARGESRTRIGISPLDPKSSASTISATLAQETSK